jgi:hypothetical protein
MTDRIFSEARRIFEVLPGEGTLERAIGKLSGAGVDHSRIRGWANSISEEYGIAHYVGPALDRMMIGAAKLSQAEG